MPGLPSSGIPRPSKKHQELQTQEMQSHIPFSPGGPAQL